MPFRCKEKQAAYNKQYQQENKESLAAYNKSYSLRILYGLTEEDYQGILEAQDGCCPICLKHHTEFPKRLAVDHIHDCVGDVDYNKGVSAAVRGLLCNSCNKGLGILGDSMDNLIRAIGYKMANDLCPFTLTKRQTHEED